MTWTPPPRPQWVADLVVAGAELDPLALAPLDPDELFATACRRVGADDMGGVSWQTGLESLCGALATEAHLHAVGAILTRSEILRTLANRLRIVAAESDDEPALTTPWFVTGTARSGTSILHELLALDPRSRTPATWEVLDSVPAPDGGAPADDRVAGIEGAVQWWNDIAPEYLTMHENGAALPTECIFVTAHEFSSEHWSGVHDVPSYHRWTARTGAGAAYAWHRRHLGFLQSRQGPQQWVLKAPSHLGTLPALFAEYPDAWVIQTHRDPLRTVPSTISLMATLRWMRSDAVDVTRLAPTMANGVAMLFEWVRAMRADGTLPNERFIDVAYADLIRDPVATVQAIYARAGREFPPGLATGITDYLARRPRGRHGAHRYAAEDFGLDPVALREQYSPYCEAFGVTAE